MTKGFLYFFTGLIALMGVVGGIEQTVDISVFQGFQLAAVALVGIGCMVLGVSFLNDE